MARRFNAYILRQYRMAVRAVWPQLVLCDNGSSDAMAVAEGASP